MSAPVLPLMFDPGLVEEVVLLRIARHADEHEFRRARNRLYLLAEGEQREHAFQELHATWFMRLGLAQPIHTALGELPILAERCRRCLVRRAPARQDEGADLLVAEGEGRAARTVLMRLRAGAFDDTGELLALLRAELLHVADMLDPAFGYEPTLPPADGGPSYERLLRDRYRALWEVSVAGRLTRRGVARPDAKAEAYRVFVAAFAMLGASADAAFARFFDADTTTHAALMAFAAAPRGAAARGLTPGGRCPLCRFPTYAPEPAPEHLGIDVVQHIVADFPEWRRHHGLCRQCADLYRARAVSAPACA